MKITFEDEGRQVEVVLNGPGLSKLKSLVDSNKDFHFSGLDGEVETMCALEDELRTALTTTTYHGARLLRLVVMLLCRMDPGMPVNAEAFAEKILRK